MFALAGVAPAPKLQKYAVPATVEVDVFVYVMVLPWQIATVPATAGGEVEKLGTGAWQKAKLVSKLKKIA